MIRIWVDPRAIEHNLRVGREEKPTIICEIDGNEERHHALSLFSNEKYIGSLRFTLQVKPKNGPNVCLELHDIQVETN